MASVLLFIVGQCVFVGAISLVWRANARRWNRLARAYRTEHLSAGETQLRMQTLILVGGNIAFNSYKGTVTIGLTHAGITLRLLGPFAIYHPPLCIPYSDIDVRPTSWYLNSASFKYSFAQVDDVEIIIDEELKSWIETNVAHLSAVELNSLATPVG